MVKRRWESVASQTINDIIARSGLRHLVWHDTHAHTHTSEQAASHAIFFSLQEGKTAAMIALERGNYSCLILLIAARANLRRVDLHRKSHVSFFLIIICFFRRYFPGRTDTWTHSCAVMVIIIFHLCVDVRACVRFRCRRYQGGKTLAMHAIEHDSKAALDVLLSAGINVNHPDKVRFAASKFSCLKLFIISTQRSYHVSRF